MKIILITGIPGMGKTKIGNHLKGKYDFNHIDLEDGYINSSFGFSHHNQNTLNPDLLMQEIKNDQKSAAITWGFYPGVHDQLLLRLQALGATMFWLDGDRLLAKEAWKNRDNPIHELLFDAQIQRIDAHNIQGIFSPVNYDTFDIEKRSYKNIENIVSDVFALLSSKV